MTGLSQVILTLTIWNQVITGKSKDIQLITALALRALDIICQVVQIPEFWKFCDVPLHLDFLLFRGLHDSDVHESPCY
ncbi:MAG: hypothetical protein EBR51_00780 [Gammaproteobacteria bacterium]|nr:hypothetical protein [Gammaproteobacteria bacterium]